MTSRTRAARGRRGSGSEDGRSTRGSPQDFTDGRATSGLRGCVPPAWAMSGRPPPLPPTCCATKFTSSPAFTLAVRSAVTPAISDTLPSATEPRTIAADLSRCLSLSMVSRRVFASAPSSVAASTLAPFTSTACAARSSPWLAASFDLSRASSLSSARFSSRSALSLSFSAARSEEHTSELQSLAYLVCRLLLEKKKKTHNLCTPQNPEMMNRLQRTASGSRHTDRVHWSTAVRAIMYPYTTSHTGQRVARVLRRI